MCVSVHMHECDREVVGGNVHPGLEVREQPWVSILSNLFEILLGILLSLPSVLHSSARITDLYLT